MKSDISKRKNRYEIKSIRDNSNYIKFVLVNHSKRNSRKNLGYAVLGSKRFNTTIVHMNIRELSYYVKFKGATLSKESFSLLLPLLKYVFEIGYYSSRDSKNSLGASYSIKENMKKNLNKNNFN